MGPGFDTGHVRLLLDVRRDDRDTSLYGPAL